MFRVNGFKKVKLIIVHGILNALFFVLVAQNTFAVDANFTWQSSSPGEQGMSRQKLDALRDILAAKETQTFLVIRNDKIVYEWYGPEGGVNRRHYTASLAKALVGGMSLLVALNDTLLDIDAPACRYIPRWKTHPVNSTITIRQLATHSSGLEDAEQNVKDERIPHKLLTGWKGAFWRKEPDPFTISRDQTPIIFRPGTGYEYSNPGMAMLAYVVTASLQNTPYSDIRTLLRERIMKPIGVKEDEWSVGYNKTYKVDGLDLVANWGGGAYTARAVARVGRLMLRKGNWQGKQLLNPAWIEKVTGYAGTPLAERSTSNPKPASGLCWYTNFDGYWQMLPRDAFAGIGAGNQVLLVVPSLDLIVVRNGEILYDVSQGEGFWSGIIKHLINPLMDAIINSPYPPSKDIIKVQFAPPASIVRKAKGSDNWPMTWADDDNQYTAYGDGWGFAPQTDIKLSLGIAKVSGAPGEFEGVNIRTESGERVGQGKYGPKACGMLMVDGVLYMLVRNTGNSQLAWSDDHGKTWSWSDWKFEISFGYPTFLNFGKNYENARDNFVYVYSHDCGDAYKPADRMVLARVPKDQIKNRNAYEFFCGMDSAGTPVWSMDMRRRGPVFIHPARCYRSGISYNAGLDKYLWCQIIPGGDTRSKGGFAIYDAPEPWGPWTTVFYTLEWDVGPGETSVLPTKWMSADGKTCYLVFSGDDAFSVRKVTFTSP